MQSAVEAKEPREFDDLTLVRGDLVYPGEPAYLTAVHTWNGQNKKRPRVVVRARGAADVVAAVKYAAAKNLPLAAKSGGHSMTCLSDGMVIDLGLMRGIRLDQENKVVRVEAGCLLGDLDAELAPFGLVVPAGIVSHTGVAGLTLGGGVGYLTRQFGLTCDHLISVDIVTADGQLRVASKTQNSDLFWAVRGAGANFGVVTSFEFRCDPLEGPVFAGPTIFPFPRLEEVGKVFVDVVTSPEKFPNEAHFSLVITHGPDGRPAVVLSTVFNGSIEKGTELIQPFTALGPVMQMVGPQPFVAVQKSTDAMVPHGRNYYQSGIFVKNVTEEIIAIIAKHYPSAGPGCVVMVETEGGKIAEVPDDECAVAWRSNNVCVNVVAGWDDDGDEEKSKAWVRGLATELRPFKSESTYINMFNIPPEEKDKIPVADFFGPHEARVRELKQKWDPNNLFRAQTNILKAP